MHHAESLFLHKNVLKSWCGQTDMNPFISTAWLWVIRGWWGVVGGRGFFSGEEEDSWEPVERSSVYKSQYAPLLAGKQGFR
jgi:hypothetical protein